MRQAAIVHLRAHGAATATGGQHRARPHRTLPVRLGAARWALELASARLGSGCASSAESLRASYSTRAMGHGGDCALGAQVSMSRGRQRTDHAVAAPRLGASAAAQAGHNEPCRLIVVCHFSAIEL